jgi:hypothetical protein
MTTGRLTPRPASTCWSNGVTVGRSGRSVSTSGANITELRTSFHGASDAASCSSNQVDEIAVPVAPVEPLRILVVRLAHGHPLEPRLPGRRLPVAVVALTRLVVLRPVAPGVVGHLVVVDGDHPRTALVEGGQVGIGLVAGVPAAVVLEGHDLVGRIVEAAVGAPVATVAVLVEVVAEVEDGVEVVAPREVAVGGEEPALEVAARDQAEAEAVDRLAGRGGGAAAADG